MLDMKLQPKSDCITLGNLTNANNLIICDTIFLALIFLIGNASGIRVVLHMNVSRYSFQDFVLRRVPKKSMLNGSSNDGVSCSGAHLIF